MSGRDIKWLRLEPYEAEVSRTVLRGLGSSHEPRLPGEIAIAQRYEKAVAAEEFQVWKLTVHPNNKATLSCEDGNDKVVFTKEIKFTDFLPEGITLWFENDVIYLPSEH